jgi:hypothetical protein
MPTLTPGIEPNQTVTVNLQTAQGGNADSTNVLDRGSAMGPAALQINSTAGATPTVTVNVLGSIDGVNFYNIPYATVAAPATPVNTALTITTTTIQLLYLLSNFAWRYLKLNMSANTNVTLTSDVFITAG